MKENYENSTSIRTAPDELMFFGFAENFFASFYFQKSWKTNISLARKLLIPSFRVSVIFHDDSELQPLIYLTNGNTSSETVSTATKYRYIESIVKTTYKISKTFETEFFEKSSKFRRLPNTRAMIEKFVKISISKNFHD